MVVTQEYLAGELSVLLAGLGSVVGDRACAQALVRLRREAETVPVTALCSVTERAVEVIEKVCWDSVTEGDTAAFSRQAVAVAELYEFGVCAGLLPDR